MMVVHVATLVSLISLLSLSSVVCIHIAKNIAEQRLCNNVPM
jgi:hypothetical protein